MSSNIVTTSDSPTTVKFGYIEVNRPTKKHKEWLEKKGYKVAVEEVHGKIYFKTEVTEFIQEITVSVDSLKELTERKQALTYNTKGFVDGEEKKNMKLCWALGPASALVMKTEEEVHNRKAEKAPHRFDF